MNITNNTIQLNTAGTTGGASYIHACLRFRAAFGIISNNMINFISQTATESAPYRVYMEAKTSVNNNETTNRSSCIISKNIFERYQALSKALVILTGGTGQNCVFSDNIFTGFEVADSSTSPQFLDLCIPAWTKVRNKNQTGKIKLNATHGAVFVRSDNRYHVTSAPDENQFNVKTFSSNIFPSVSDGTNGLTFYQSYISSGISFTWSIPLLHILPLGSRITTLKMTLVITSGWTSGSVRLQAGGNITSPLTTTISATGVGGVQTISFSGNTLDNTMEISLENNPFIIVDCSPTLTASTTALHTGNIDLEVSYRQ